MERKGNLMTYRPDIKVFDATIRDGGLVNSFRFSDEFVKALYLATFEATKKWTMPLRNWGKVYGELSIMYDGRL